MPEQLERIAQREIPPELRPLAEDDADALRKLDALTRRLEVENADVSGRGDEDPR